MGKTCDNCLDLSGDNCSTVKSGNVVYLGPDLPCSTIKTYDTLTVALQKLDAQLCLATGGQTLQVTLVTGNIATDIGAMFVSSIDPLIYTEILHDMVTSGAFVKIGGLPIEYLMADGSVTTITDIYDQLITQTITDGDIDHAPSSDAVFDALADIEASVTDLLTQSVTDGDTTHAPSSDAVYDAIQAATAGAVFDANIPVVLSGGKTLGKYVNGQTIIAIGKTAQQVITDIALEYINPAFSSFSVTGQATTIEVGTTLSGNKTFTWGINVGSGTVPTIDLYDNTAAATLLAGTPNDGTQVQAITNIQLNADGSTQSWKGIANNTAPPGTINSGNFVVTSRFFRFWAPVAAYPANPLDGAANRTYALALSNAFKTPGANTFVMPTGTVQNRFIVLLPPGVTLVSVIDLTNANTNITASFLLSAITINDAGGTARNYNMYQYTNAIPYSSSANLSITTT